MVVTCNEPTEHYSSGRALLLAFDTILKDETLSLTEVAHAVLAYMPPDATINEEELRFIMDCYEFHDGDINEMCPPSMPTSFWIFLLVVAMIIMYLLGGKK